MNAVDKLKRLIKKANDGYLFYLVQGKDIPTEDVGDWIADLVLLEDEIRRLKYE